jgi:hypothetical protein
LLDFRLRDTCARKQHGTTAVISTLPTRARFVSNWQPLIRNILRCCVLLQYARSHSDLMIVFLLVCITNGIMCARSMSTEQESNRGAIRTGSSVRAFVGMGAVTNCLSKKFAMVLSARQNFKLISKSTIGRWVRINFNMNSLSTADSSIRTNCK